MKIVYVIESLSINLLTIAYSAFALGACIIYSSCGANPLLNLLLEVKHTWDVNFLGHLIRPQLCKDTLRYLTSAEFLVYLFNTEVVIYSSVLFVYVLTNIQTFTVIVQSLLLLTALVQLWFSRDPSTLKNWHLNLSWDTKQVRCLQNITTCSGDTQNDLILSLFLLERPCFSSLTRLSVSSNCLRILYI